MGTQALALNNYITLDKITSLYFDILIYLMEALHYVIAIKIKWAKLYQAPVTESGT